MSVATIGGSGRGLPAPALARANSGAARPRYLPYGDAARVLGTIAVVVAHVCDLPLFDPGGTGISRDGWWFCNLVDASCRWAVPVYVMLSGALLLDPARTEPFGQFYKKRLARLGIPIVFWSAFYMWFAVYYTHWQTSEQAWLDLAMGKPYAHLHFVFRIAGLYAFTPMLRVFLAHASPRLVATVTLLTLGLAIADSVMTAFTGSELTAFLRFVPFLAFYLLGYQLRDRVVSRRTCYACWALGITCALVLAGGTGLLVSLFGYQPYPSLGFMLYDFLSPVRVTMGLCAWLILVRVFDQRWLESRAGRFTSRWLAPATLGIYLVHPFFRDVLYVNGYGPTRAPVWIGVPAMTALVYTASLVFTLVVMRIPFVKRIAG